MKTKLKAFTAICALFLAFGSFCSAQVTGPSPICPGQTYTYYWTGELAANCTYDHWEASNSMVYVGGGASNSLVSSPDIGSSSFTLSYYKVCSTGSGTNQDPIVYTTSSAGSKVITVNGVENVVLTPSISSLACNTTSQTFTVTAGSTNANLYVWSISGGGTIPTPTNGSVVTIVKPASCSSAITVYCTAKRSDCAGYSGRSSSITIPVSAALPTTISGLSSMCSTSSNTYSVTAGPNSCWTYNWYFSSGGTGMVISNPSSSTTSISYGAGASPGNKVLNCTINACGRSILLTKNINICAAVAAPTDIAYSRQGTTCYYKFTTPAVCADYYEWQVNNGPIESNAGNILTPYEPGTYTVKVRIVNGCGTSAWRTETWTLGGGWTGCMWKSAPGEVDHEITADPQAAASNESLDFAIIPNPTGGSRNVEIQCAAELVGGTIELYGINGAKIFAGKVEATHFSLNTASIESGLYICRIINGEKMVTRKLVVTE